MEEYDNVMFLSSILAVIVLIIFIVVAVNVKAQSKTVGTFLHDTIYGTISNITDTINSVVGGDSTSVDSIQDSLTELEGIFDTLQAETTIEGR